MHVVVNAATSADGKLSSRERTQVAISGPADFRRVDELRARSDAVMVGVGTVLADDPSLTVKDESLLDGEGPSAQPARVVADSRLRTPTDAAVLDDAAETYLLVTEGGRPEDPRRVDARLVVAGEDRVALPAALDRLAAEGIDRLLVEGGGELVAGLFAADLVDELSVYVAPMIIGGRDAPTLVDGEGFTPPFPQLELDAVERLDEGVLLRYTPE